MVSFIWRPAGYFSSQLLSVTKQVCLQAWISIFRSYWNSSKYWYDSYGNIRYALNTASVTNVFWCFLYQSFPFGTSQQSDLVVMIHDAFQSLSYWNGFMPAPNWQGVILDTHIYQMFSVAVSSKFSTFLTWLTWTGYTGQPDEQCAAHSNSLWTGFIAL